MKKLSYFFTFIFVLFVDRLSKSLALSGFFTQYSGKFLSFDLILNRGISWGILHNANNNIFLMLGCFIVLIMSILAIHTYQKIKMGSLIFGEILVFAGAISNLYDRYSYSGVIDFIVLSIKSYSWPVFNIADACIVFGAIIMFKESFK
jgi:signal peptidase II